MANRKSLRLLQRHYVYKKNPFKKDLDDAEKKLHKAIKKYGEDSPESQQARGRRNLRRIGHEDRKERRNKVRAAKKELGRIDHPINLQTGKLQTADEVKKKFNEQFATIEGCAKEADLSASSIKRIDKARRAFDAILAYVSCFLIFFLHTCRI